jgi:trans-aconitate methyltransferase
MSGYGVTAQFYDAMAGEQHAGIDAQITAVLKGLENVSHPIVDIGAGTGLTTRVIADALPDAEIFAVEPDAAMRPALMTRIWSDPDLRRRVSILPMSILEAPLPQVVSAAVASASLVHFSPSERNQLWSLLADRLSSTARILIEVQCPLAQDIPERCMVVTCIGQVEYQGWAAVSRVDEFRQKWKMTYVARLNGLEIDRQFAEYICWTISAEQVLAEAAAIGLHGSIVGDLVVLGTEVSMRR